MYKKKSILGNFWKIQDCDERSILSLCQKYNIAPLLARLLLVRKIDINLIHEYLNPNIHNNLPNPFLLKDMEKSVDRTITAIVKDEKIGIISDYDVDGSTSATILYKFLNLFTKKIYLKIPNRLSEGYGPNIRIMDEMRNNNVNLLFTLDCGTSSFNILDNEKFVSIDTIIIDHHISENKLPKVYSVINPNRYDEDSLFKDMAAVGITFLFLMALRNKMRNKNIFKENFVEPNLINYLDLVALGTVCDIVKLTKHNRFFVKKGLELITKRKNKSITSILDNSNIQSAPNSSDLGYIIGPQLNAASRLDDSSLPTKLLINNNLEEIESITRKLSLLNEKRKLIENEIFEEAIKQAEKQKDQRYILVYGENWHNGILGIIASKIKSKFYKPTFVISFDKSFGIGSARSIKGIDLSQIILNAKHNKILISGGGHKMASGFKIKKENIDNLNQLIMINLNNYSNDYFQKIEKFDHILSINEINDTLLDIFDQMEPFGEGNPEPQFLIQDIQISKLTILKNKHILIFFQNDFFSNLKAICFNCINTLLGDYLLDHKNTKLLLACTIKKNNFDIGSPPQLIIKDAMLD